MGAQLPKKYGLLENSTRGIWSLNANSKDLTKCDPQAVVQFVQALRHKTAEKEKGNAVDSTPVTGATGNEGGLDLSESPLEEQEWKQKLHAILTQKLSP